MNNPIYATEGAPSIVKSTYGYVDTNNIVGILQAKGWVLEKTQVAQVRDARKEGYQKHLLTFSNPAFPLIPGLTEANATKPTLSLLNSHDTSSRVVGFLGGLRFACLNGIIAGLSLRSFSAVHSKHVTARIGTGVEYLTEGLPELFKQIQALQYVRFTASQEDRLMRAVYDARLANVHKVVDVGYIASPQREQDKEVDGFTVLNRIQEKVMRGGIQYRYERNVTAANGLIIGTKTVNATTRKLTSITAQVKLNEIVYAKALEVAGIKQAA